MECVQLLFCLQKERGKKKRGDLFATAALPHTMPVGGEWFTENKSERVRRVLACKTLQIMCRTKKQRR